MASSHYSGDSPLMSLSHPGFAVLPDLVGAVLMSPRSMDRGLMLRNRSMAAGATFSLTPTIA